MPRRKAAIKREALPDPMYGSVELSVLLIFDAQRKKIHCGKDRLSRA